MCWLSCSCVPFFLSYVNFFICFNSLHIKGEAAVLLHFSCCSSLIRLSLNLTDIQCHSLQRRQLLTVVFIQRTRGDRAVVGGYFQWWIDPHLVLWWLFLAAGRCLCSWWWRNISPSATLDKFPLSKLQENPLRTVSVHEYYNITELESRNINTSSCEHISQE